MALIKSTGYASWGFELPQVGWQAARVHETIEIKGTKKDETKKMLVVPFCIGDADKPCVTAYCLLDSIQGLRRIVDIVVATKLHEVLLREKKYDLTQGVEENVVKGDKFLNWVMAKLAGRPLELNIQHREYDAEDDTGNKVKRKQADIKDIRPLNDKDKDNEKPKSMSQAVAEVESGWE